MPRCGANSVLGKYCAGPPKGGSAGGCVRYILGDTLGRLHNVDEATREQRHEAFHGLMRESLMRPDLGVGTVWRPSAGDGVRPSAIYARNVTSLATAAVEMDALAAVAKSRRVKEPVLHMVFSVDSKTSKAISDEKTIDAVKHVLAKLDLGDNAYVVSIHRDTDNVHAHVAVATVNAKTLQAWNRQRNFPRLHWALRETEIEVGLPHDRGLAVVRGEGQARRVEWATAAERSAWRHENHEAWLVEKARAYQPDYKAYEDPESWVRDVVVPRLEDYVEKARERGEDLRWIDMHAVAAYHACRLDMRSDGTLLVRVMEPVGERPKREDRAKARAAIDGAARVVHGEETAHSLQREAQRVVETLEVTPERLLGYRPETKQEHAIRKTAAIGAAVVAGPASYQEELHGKEGRWYREYCNDERATEMFVEQARRNPGLISREIVADGQAVFSRGDIDAFICKRVSDPETAEALAEWIEQKDSSLVVLSPDAEHPLFTTQAQRDLEKTVAAKVKVLSQTTDPWFDRDALDRAIVDVESERGFVLSEEQRRVLDGMRAQLSWVQGDAGTGKTVTMRVVRRYAEIADRQFVGMSLTQAASEKLGRETGGEGVNLTRALVRDSSAVRKGEKPVIEPGAIVVLDETSMLDMRQFNHLLSLANQRQITLVGIGDAAQLKPIGAGDVHRVVSRMLEGTGRYSEMHQVYRQRDELEWMRPVVHEFGKSIREGDADGVRRCVATMDEHGVFVWCKDRDETIAAAASAYVEHRKRGEAVVLNVDAHLSVKHLNQEIRKQLGMGHGVTFTTRKYGLVDVVEGERIVFLKNTPGLGVLNGDVATIEGIRYCDPRRRGGQGHWEIEAEIDGGRVVKFNPGSYQHWAYGYAVTVHKAQGQSETADIYAVTKPISDASLAFVGLTRGEKMLNIFGSQHLYKSSDDFGDALAKCIEPKTDVILFQEMIDRYGGPNTYWAIAVRRAMEDDRDPLKKQWREEERRKSERREREIRQVVLKFQKAVSLATANGQRKAIGRAMDKEVAGVVKQRAPQTFVQWAATQRPVIEDQQTLLGEVGQRRTQRGKGREQARERGRGREVERAVEPGAEHALEHGPERVETRGVER